MRTVIIGDIHGCSAAFGRLLSVLRPDPETDRLILLGDLFDRGPDSWEVFQKVRELQLSFGERFVLLRGNHEDYLLQKHLSLSQRLLWERVGRKASVRSFKEHGERLSDAASWIEAHSVLYFKSGESHEEPADRGKDRDQAGVSPGFFQCVHAGLLLDPPEMNDTWTLLHDHNIVLQNEYNGPVTITGHIALAEPSYFAGDGETVRILPEQVWMPLPELGILCIDTGCGKGGRLTGMVIENGQFYLNGVDA